ncbi:MAG: BTAD domain-containing putative transcriptional regulator [Phycisphaerales bacterium]
MTTPKALAAASILLAVVAGCATPPHGNPLVVAAVRERPNPPASVPPAPSLVAAEAVAPRTASEAVFAANLSFPEASRAIREANPQITSPPPVQATGPGDDGDAREALAAYLRGRVAMQEGNLPMAVGEFERAHRLDPGEVSILRQLGRAYSQAGNGPRAAEAFRRLRGLEPADPEALFLIGMTAANRREWAEAATALLVLREEFEAGRGDPSLATLVAVDFAIANCLAELGHDRAFLEAAERALAAPLEELAANSGDNSDRLGELFRRRSDVAQQMGDAWMRLGDPMRAAERYRAAMELPTADPRLLRARLVHALIVAGRPLAAQAELLAVLEEPGAAGDAEVELAGYLREHAGDVRILVEEVESRSKARPDEAGLVRVLARLDPQTTVRLLADLAARTASGDAVGELLAWIEQVDPDGAVAIAADLVGRNPESLEPAALRLAQLNATPAELRARLEALPPTAASAALEGALLVALRDASAAWPMLKEAAANHPGDPAIARARAIAAASLGAATLVAEVERAPPPANATEAIPIAFAYLLAAASEQAWRLIESIEDSEGEELLSRLSPKDRAAWLVLSSRIAAAESGQSVGAVQQVWRSIAVGSAEAAIAADPRSVAAWEWLIALRDPRNGRAPDTAAHEQAIRRMVAALEGEALVERLRAEEDLARGRVDSSVRRLDGILAKHPDDGAALRALITTLARAGRQAEIVARLDTRRRDHPSAPIVWEIWAGAMLTAGRAVEAESILRGMLEDDADHPFAEVLLAALLRSSGRFPEAESIVIERIDERPATPTRTLARAEWHLERSARLAAVAARSSPGSAELDAVAAESDAAVRLVRSLVASVPQLSRSEQTKALSIALQASPDVPGRTAAIAELAQAILATDQEAPLAVHGAAILAAVTDGADEAQIAELALAATQSRGAAAVDDEAAIRWLGIAERLLAAGHPEAAAETLRAATLEIPWPAGEARRTLRAAVVGLDARIGGRADRTIEYLDALSNAGGFEDGETLMRRDPEASSRPPSRLMDASGIYSIVGDRAGASSLLEAVLEASPDEAMALNNLAYGRLDDGLLDAETERMLERAFELMPADSHVLDSLGWLRYRQGHLADGPQGFGAVSLLREAVKANGENASLEGLDHLGDALWVAGDREEALRTWQRALEAGLRRFDRESTVRGIEGFLRGEFGLVIRDPAEFYEESYGAVIDRVRAKIRAANDRREPPVADTPALHAAPVKEADGESDPPDPPAAP